MGIVFHSFNDRMSAKGNEVIAKYICEFPCCFVASVRNRPIKSAIKRLLSNENTPALFYAKDLTVITLKRKYVIMLQPK